jgi:excisionase family DNA binding protein
MPVSDFLTPAECARELRVSSATIYRLLEQRRIQAVKVGAQYRISRKDVLAATRQAAPEAYSYMRAGAGASDRRS